MTRRVSQREDCIQKLSAYVLDTGLEATSLRQLASAADVSDRMLLYYFKNKSEIMSEVLLRAASDMTNELNEALPLGQRMAPAALLEIGAGLVNEEKMQPYMRLSVEIAAYAGRGKEPYASAAKAIIEGFLNWISQRLDTADDEKRQAQSAMILAIIDGFGILSIGVSDETSQRAMTEVIFALT